MKTLASSQSILTSVGRNMTYRDLKRQAISLGMDFEESCNMGIWGLIQYISRASNRTPDWSKVQAYDKWIDQILENQGYEKDDPIRDSRLRLSYISDDPNRPKMPKIKGVKKAREKKPPREKDTNNLWKGTKKSYTFELAQRGFPLERVQRRVKKKFMDANDKSISIWYRQAIRQSKK